MKSKAVYFDLDGVMADYDAGIRAMGFTPDPALNRSSHLLPGSGSAKKREMYEAVKGTTFYADLPLYDGSAELFATAWEADPIILTAAPKFGATEDDYYLNPYWLGAAFHKRWWVEHRLLPAVLNKNLVDLPKNMLCEFREDGFVSRVRIPDERFICTTSARKYQFMHRKHSDHQILVDDRPDNIGAWRKAGGIGIEHVSCKDSIQQLKALM
jgi:hypothetical protein